MPTIHKQKVKMTTLTIRIDADLKDEVLALAKQTGEDASTWIRRFFERIRRTGGDSERADWIGDEDGEFSPEFIASVERARKGSFKKFRLQDYV